MLWVLLGCACLNRRGLGSLVRFRWREYFGFNPCTCGNENSVRGCCSLEESVMELGSIIAFKHFQRLL